MNIIELAKEAGFTYYDEYPSSLTVRFEKLAALVRAEALDEAAKVCEKIGQGGIGDIGDDTTTLCAAAIRKLK